MQVSYILPSAAAEGYMICDTVSFGFGFHHGSTSHIPCLSLLWMVSPSGLLLSVSDTGPRPSESRHLSKSVMFQVNICKLVWVTLCVYAAGILVDNKYTLN